MRLVFLDETKSQNILAFLETEERVNIGKEANCKQFIEAVLWLALVLLGATVGNGQQTTTRTGPKGRTQTTTRTVNP